jgi:hypothetical protein
MCGDGEEVIVIRGDLRRLPCCVLAKTTKRVNMLITESDLAKRMSKQLFHQIGNRYDRNTYLH